jgi:hypothetical protein
MTTQSNSYVEKVLSEHPLAIWLLGEKLDYISYLTESNRYIETGSQWALTNCTATFIGYDSNTPFKDSHVSVISSSVPSTTPITLQLKSVFTINPATFDSELSTFSIGFYAYIDSTYVSNISFGYTYYDTVALIDKDVLVSKDISLEDYGTWVFCSSTYEIPIESATNMKLLIKATSSVGGIAGDYDIQINGLSLGQWSEEFHKTSLGVSVSPIPTDISISNTFKCVEAKPYGLFGDSAYYIASASKLYGKNFGIPLVYGSSNVTKIYPHIWDGAYGPSPSLIFPGNGFLNERGKYNEYTAEMWISIDTDTENPIKIFGPIASDDGIYVENGFLTLVVGSKYGSHFVGEWFRPMLIHIRYSDETASLYLNGEEVIKFTIDQNDIAFPSEFDNTGRSQDWLAFYANENIYPMSLDSFAIYSYAIPVEVAKRRWVWGQGVTPPEITNSSINAVTAFNDYAYSDYAVNYNYPDYADWKQAFFSNMNTSLKHLSLPDYKLPKFVLGDFSTEEFYDSMIPIQEEGNNLFTFRPDPAWDDQTCYFEFNSLDVLNEKVVSLYGVFKSSETLSQETLFKITNKYSNDYFMAYLDGLDLVYKISISGNIRTYTFEIVEDQRFAVGFNIDLFSQIDLDGADRFFSNPSSLLLRVGGDGTSTFAGIIYNFGFNAGYNDRALQAIDAYYDSGIINPLGDIPGTLLSELSNYRYFTGNYVLVPITKYGLFFADIAASGYWQDYMPLSYFAKYVNDSEGNEVYGLDSLQINFDFPSPVQTVEQYITPSLTYYSLQDQMLNPTPRDYEYLSNNIYTGWDTYADLGTSFKLYYYDTTNNLVRTYVSFQYLADGANKTLIDFDNLFRPESQGVVRSDFFVNLFQPLGIDVQDIAHEIIDGTIVEIPTINTKGRPVDFNDLAIVYHIEFKSEGILHHPFKFRKLQTASQSFSRDQFTEIGTKFGQSVYPYTKRGIYYDFESSNPIATYKGSTPHLYLSRHTGWRLRGFFEDEYDRGLAILVNGSRAEDVSISGLQMWVRYSEYGLPESPVPIFSVEHDNGKYVFYLVEDESQKRGKIIGKDSITGLELTDVSYYINGQPVDSPYILYEDWSVVNVSFNDLLHFNGNSGQINLNGPMTYNNVSYFTVGSLQQEQSYSYNPWSSAIELGTWGTVNDFIWEDISLTKLTTVIANSPSEIYDRYVGSERIVVDDNIDGILVDPLSLRIFNGVSWTTSTITPV